jgi:hypothetical protein
MIAESAHTNGGASPELSADDRFSPVTPRQLLKLSLFQSGRGQLLLQQMQRLMLPVGDLTGKLVVQFGASTNGRNKWIVFALPMAEFRLSSFQEEGVEETIFTLGEKILVVFAPKRHVAQLLGNRACQKYDNVSVLVTELRCVSSPGSSESKTFSGVTPEMSSIRLRANQRKRLAFVAAINAKVRVEGEDGGIGPEFRHADEAGVSEGHGDVGVAGHQFMNQ